VHPEGGPVDGDVHGAVPVAAFGVAEGEAEMIPRTPALHEALRDAAAHRLDYYPGWLGGHHQGFAWHGGGEVPQSEQDALSTLTVVHLIDAVPARVGGEIGCEVVLTSLGAQVLAQWEA
jgi:hypothetical protein